MKDIDLENEIEVQLIRSLIDQDKSLLLSYIT